ncbi:hypothetical protein [Dyadobacter sp. CY312]|uniref:hypothetical protein n=1 Tax=Dyadobacter sp. CY312 TaxID=2907303 RepID=UPI001F366FB5|nr:hypothetical protein [Dyadobacter sp. CY312]MCE7041354.1 hypothetical protein [Dyadobacter sp. CY312]
MKRNKNLFFLFLCLCHLALAQPQTKIPVWKEAAFEMVGQQYGTYKTADLGHVFLGKKNCIVRVAPELDGITGIKLPLENQDGQIILKLKEPAKILVGFFHETPSQKIPANAEKILAKGVTITGMPPVDVYAIPYKKGVQTIKLNIGQPYVLLGVVQNKQILSPRNVDFPDGREWEPYVVEGFSEKKALFEILGGQNDPVVDQKSPGAEAIQGGFEGGAMVKVGAVYHMFPTERAGEIGQPSKYDRIKTRIGHWTSGDAIHWKRQSTVYQASGTYAITRDDNPLNDRRAALWSFMPVFNKETNRWNGFYLAYVCDEETSPNHSFGRIWRSESEKEGMEGVGGPYRDLGIVMEPGWDSQLWEGRQGVDSFFPFKVGNQWLSFYGGAYPYEKRDDYPTKMGKGWFVGLAKSDKLEGPWTRMDTTINPIRSMHPWFIENPIVSQLPDSTYIAMFDGGPDDWGHHLPNMFGYSLSKDGITWTEAHYFPIHTKVKKWWDIMRTPLGIIPEGNNEYTIVYAAIDKSKRFHPMGMVKVKLNTEVLSERRKELK